MEAMSHCITLLTDFGISDHFVAAMKGVMLKINPQLRLLDISHLIPPQDVRSAAFTLGQTYTQFPDGTIHLAVVDPGVGTDRKALVASAGGHFFVAPDNGLLTYVLEQENTAEVVEITEDHFFNKPVAPTFHGRDIFAPVAAWLTRDITLEKFGPPLKNPVHLKLPTLTRVRDSLIQATVLAVDHFGNLITNLKPFDVPAYTSSGDKPCKILANKREIKCFRKTFGEGEPGELMVIPGSTGYLEIVERSGSAAQTLNMGPGGLIGVVLG
jgi:S-adenosylmethionine hydrolase